MRKTQSHPQVALRFRRPVPLLCLLTSLLLLGGSQVLAGPKPAGTSPATVSIPDRLVLRVYFRSLAERDRLANELDALEVPTTEGYLTVLSDRAALDALLQQGLRVEVDAQQTARINKNVTFGNSPDNFYGGYHTVEEMYQYLDDMVAAHPNLAEVVDYGDSWCKAHPGQCTLPEPNNGYDLKALHIANRNISGPKPVFWAEAGIHAREIGPAEIALDYIGYLLDNYDTDADAHWLVDWHDIYVIPTINPDGHHIVEAGGGGSNPYYQRKNANFTNGCNTWPPAIGNQFGTDINRNFPFLWNCCGGSSGDPCNEAYHGTAAISDDETHAVVGKISQLIPDQRGPDINDPAPITTTGTFVDLHSFGNVDLYSWDMYNQQQAPNVVDLRNIGFHMSATSAYPPGNDYTPCQFGHCLYIADGATNDWVYGELGAAGFAVEIGDTFFPPYSVTQDQLWPQNRGMLLYLARIARMPYLLTRGPDTIMTAATPMTVTQGIPSELTATINYAWDYHGATSAYIQDVAAAEYYLDTPPWAGGTPVAMQPTDGQFDSPVEGVRATVPTGSISVGRHILFVRGRGINDYEGYQSWGPVSAAWLVVQPYASPTATVTGTPPTATRTRTTAPTSTPTATPCASGVLQNGGFETGSLGPWTILDTDPTPTISTLHRHSGSYALFLGSIPNNEPFGSASVYQRITVPASGGTLSYWYYPYSRDNIQFDWQDAYITDENGNILATVMHVLQGTETWTNITYSLDPYAGQTIRIKFLVHQDGAGDVANMYVDDVLIIQACASSGSPTPAVTSTSTSVIATATTITVTPVPPTATACTIQFTDVLPGSTFYDFVRCLACRGFVAGYPDGSFRPNNNVTRGQLSKIISNAAGFNEPQTTQMFEDVPVGSTFFDYIGRLASREYISGYPCGGSGEPCVSPGSLPYFRPNNNATRGQISKIDSNAAQFSDPPTGQQFEDVAPGSTYYTYTYRLVTRSIMRGYSCGGPGEPCVSPGSLPYFRPNNNATRGQTSKIVANTFYPSCQTPMR